MMLAQTVTEELRKQAQAVMALKGRLTPEEKMAAEAQIARTQMLLHQIHLLTAQADETGRMH